MVHIQVCEPYCVFMAQPAATGCVLECGKDEQEGPPPPLCPPTNHSSREKSNLYKEGIFVGHFWYTNPQVSDPRPPPKQRCLPRNSSPAPSSPPVFPPRPRRCPP